MGDASVPRGEGRGKVWVQRFLMDDNQTRLQRFKEMIGLYGEA